MKTCIRCQRDYPLTSFHRNGKTNDGLSSYCKTCMKERVAEWRNENPDKVAINRRKDYLRHKDKREARRKERNLSNPAHVRALQAKHARKCRLRKRGLNEATLMEKLEAQGLVCALCDTGITLKTAVVDHCHETGKTRDLLCRKCNMALGHLEKDAFYNRAMAYIARHRTVG